MKTIVETSTKLSKYLLADNVAITATADNITVGDPAQFIIGDLNSTTVTITESITNAPDDWTGKQVQIGWAQRGQLILIGWTQKPKTRNKQYAHHW